MIKTCHDGEGEVMKKHTLFLEKSQYLGQQDPLLGLQQSSLPAGLGAGWSLLRWGSAKEVS